MKIKEQTRKLAAGCSKHCFAVVDRTDEVSNIYTARRRWRGLNLIFEEYKKKRRLVIVPASSWVWYNSSMRLDKFLVACAVGSRTEVKNLLKAGRVTVNGKKEKSAKLQINEEKDEIRFDGQVLEYEEFVYYMMNKPQGVISATEDTKHRTVLDLLDDYASAKEVFPVGRLDIDTHGLLLLTNDGQLAHALLSPKRHVDKTYLAQVEGIMTQEDVETFAKGIPLKDFTCQPAKLEIVSVDPEKNQSLVRVTIAEGKFHQVKRMVAYCGKEVVDLQRLTMGTLALDENLERGEWRRLTKEELEVLLASIV